MYSDYNIHNVALQLRHNLLLFNKCISRKISYL